MNYIIELIKQSNFDVLGVIYFTIIIIYILEKTERNLIEYMILFGAIIGFIVDIIITIQIIKKMNNVNINKNNITNSIITNNNV